MQAAGSEAVARLDRPRRARPAKPWIVCADDGRTVSYGQLRETVGRFATFLRQRGLGPNDRVALLANNSIEHLLCYFGVMAYGATICTVHVEMNRNQLDNIFARLKPKLVLHQDGLELDDLLAGIPAPRLRLGRWDASEPEHSSPSLRAAAERRHATAQPDDDAVILFTSGTSARPKGVVLNFREHLANIDPDGRRLRHHGGRPRLRFPLVQLGLGAASGRAGAGQPRRHAGHGGKFSASRFFQHVRDHRVTVAAGNPTTINILLNSEQTAHRDNLPALRFLTSSSAPLTVEEWRRFEQFGIPIAQGYGSSETGWIAAIPGEQRRLGTVGRPFPIMTSPSSTPRAGACRRARSARSRSAALPTTPTAISPTTAA